MFSKRLSCLLLIATLLFVSNTIYSQCVPLPPPDNATFICTPGQTSLSNTSNSITVNGPSYIPAAGNYLVTTKYHFQTPYACEELQCSYASVTTTSNSFTISLGSCNNGATLPANYSSANEVDINLVPTNTSNSSYYLQVLSGVCNQAIPVTISQFQIHSAPNNTYNLTWTGNNEDDIDYYLVTRNSAVVTGSAATDMELGRVNVNANHSYSFTDLYPLSGRNWYRVLIVFKDGHRNYSTYVWADCQNCTATPPPLTNCNSFYLVGPDLLCDGTATYSLNTPVYYSTYSWWTNESYAALGNLHTPTTTLTRYGDGITNLNLVLSRCTTRSFGIGVNVGKAVTGYYYGSTGPNVNLIENTSGANYLPADYYYVNISTPFNVAPTWTLLSGSAEDWYYYASSQQLYFNLWEGDEFLFQLDINTPCGPATYYYRFIQDGSSSFYTLSPNPASSQISLAVDDRKLSRMKLARNTDQNIQQVIITDKTGKPVLQQHFAANTRNVSLNIASLKLDMYIIRVFNGKKWTVMKFIKH